MRAALPLTLIFIYLTVSSWLPVIEARQWNTTPWSQAIEYTQIIHNKTANRVVLIWWLAPEVINPATPGAEQARSVLSKYVLVGVTDGMISSLGEMTTKDIEGVKIKTMNGAKNALQAFAIPPVVSGTVTVLKSIFGRSMGKLGEGMNWLVFDPENISSCKQGKFWVVYDGVEYDYVTPIPGCPVANLSR